MFVRFIDRSLIFAITPLNFYTSTYMSYSLQVLSYGDSEVRYYAQEGTSHDLNRASSRRESKEIT